MLNVYKIEMFFNKKGFIIWIKNEIKNNDIMKFL